MSQAPAWCSLVLVTTGVGPELGLDALSDLSSYAPHCGVVVLSFGKVFEILLEIH